MLSMLLVTALAVVQYQTPAEKPAAQDTARAQPAANASAMQRDTSKAQATTAVAFRQNMRRLWQDHIGFTRNFIASATAGLGDTAQVAQRLLRNQDEIGDAIKPYFGDAAGTRLATLLRGHIQHAAHAVAVGKSRETAVTSPAANPHDWKQDTTGMKERGMRAHAMTPDDAEKALRANADSIAAFLSSANPRHWPRATLQNALYTHIDLLLQQANARAKGDWAADIAAYDASHRQVLQMADVLSDGIIKQFPNRFTGTTTAMTGSQ